MTFEKKFEELERFIAQLPTVNPLRAELLRCARELAALHEESVTDAERDAANAKTDPAPPPSEPPPEFVPPRTRGGAVMQHISVLRELPRGGTYGFWSHRSGRELLQIAHTADPRRVEYLLTDVGADDVATWLWASQIPALSDGRGAQLSIPCEKLRTSAAGE